MAKFLDHLLDLVIKLWLRSNDVESVDELRHNFLGVVSILGAHHANQVHDAFDEARVLKVEIDDEALEHILVLLDQILAKLLEKLSVPLDNGFLLFATLSLHLLVFFFEPAENVLEFISVGQDLNHSPHKSTIDVFNKPFAIDIIDFFGVLQAQNRRYYVWKLLHLHFLQKLIALLV